MSLQKVLRELTFLDRKVLRKLEPILDEEFFGLGIRLHIKFRVFLEHSDGRCLDVLVVELKEGSPFRQLASAGGLTPKD